MDDLGTMNTERTLRGRSLLAFTLVEMLTVITIMGIVAALVVTMGETASQKKKQVAVEGEKNKLITMIDSYHAKLNYYPPDNGNLAASAGNLANYEGLSATNPLIYELTGATNTGGGANLTVFNSTAAVSNLLASTYSKVFNRGGIANGDAAEPHNFFVPGPSTKEYAAYLAGSATTLPIDGLLVPADLVPGKTTNFWHYDSSSSLRHNMGSYDLWAEFYIGTKNGALTIITNGNW